jgi:NADH:ubiquinone oxidoreductase subunit K
MIDLSPASVAIIAVLSLFGIGLYGLLVTRNLIKLVAVLQVLVKSAVLGLVAAGKISGNVSLGASLAATVIVADTIVAVIGLALAVQVRQRLGTLDLNDLAKMKG